MKFNEIAARPKVLEGTGNRGLMRSDEDEMYF